MANVFSEYQNVKSMQYLYTTPELANQFKTKKLIGASEFKLEAVPTCEATVVLDLKKEGVVDLIQTYDAANHKTYYTLKLK